MKCLMTISFYGVILLNEDGKIEWEVNFFSDDLSIDENSVIPGKVCGVDYNEELNRVLIGFRYYFFEMDWSKNITWKYKFSTPSGIHSVHYTDDNNVIVSEASKDKVSIIDRKTNKSIYQWKLKDYYDCGMNDKPPYYDRGHLNYSRQFGDKIFISCLTFPDKNLEEKSKKSGLLSIINKETKEQVKIFVCKDIHSPHSFIPIEDGKENYLVASTGNGRIIRLDKYGNQIWYYEFEDVPVRKRSGKPKRPHISYTKGTHYIDQVDSSSFIVALPNHRSVRLIDWNKRTLKEWKMPEYIEGTVEDFDSGKNPRCVYAKLI